MAIEVVVWPPKEGVMASENEVEPPPSVPSAALPSAPVVQTLGNYHVECVATHVRNKSENSTYYTTTVKDVATGAVVKCLSGSDTVTMYGESENGYGHASLVDVGDGKIMLRAMDLKYGKYEMISLVAEKTVPAGPPRVASLAAAGPRKAPLPKRPAPLAKVAKKSCP